MHVITFRRAAAICTTAALVLVGIASAPAVAQAVEIDSPLDLSIELLTPEGFAAGDTVEVQFTATNTSGETLSFVSGDGVTARTYSAGGSRSIDGGCVPWGVGEAGDYSQYDYSYALPESMAPGASVSCTFTYHATAGDVSHGGFYGTWSFEPAADDTVARGWWYFTYAAHGRNAAPTIVGTPKAGLPLSVSSAYWGGWAEAFDYQWESNGEPIVGATKSTFTPTTAEVGSTLRVRITGYDSTSRTGGWVSRTTADTAVVAPASTLTSATPTIRGTARVGGTLTVAPGSWTSGTTLTYRWAANGVSIGGATAKTLTLGAAQLGRKITVTVSGKKSGYTPTSKASKATAAVSRGILAAATPTISGTAKVGSKLTAKAAGWTAGTTLTYRWYASGKSITGATKSTFTPGRSQLGKKLTVTVTGAKAGYTTLSKTSRSTAAVAR